MLFSAMAAQPCWEPTQTGAARLAHAGFKAIEAGKDEQALQHFQAALDSQPGCATPVLGIAHASMLMGRHDEALAQLDTIETATPQQVAIVFALRSEVLAMAGKGADALAAAQTALTNDPDHRAAHEAMVNALAATGQRAKAQERAHEWGLVDPRLIHHDLPDISALSNQLAQGDYAAVRKVVDPWLDSHADAPAVMRLLKISAASGQGQLDTADAELTQLTRQPLTAHDKQLVERLGSAIVELQLEGGHGERANATVSKLRLAVGDTPRLMSLVAQERLAAGDDSGWDTLAAALQAGADERLDQKAVELVATHPGAPAAVIAPLQGRNPMVVARLVEVLAKSRRADCLSVAEAAWAREPHPAIARAAVACAARLGTDAQFETWNQRSLKGPR